MEQWLSTSMRMGRDTKYNLQEDFFTDIPVFSFLLFFPIAYLTPTFEYYTVYWECFLIHASFPRKKKTEVLTISHKLS